MVSDLRDISGNSLMECKRALVKYDGDMLLAEGYLKYNGCAIFIRPPHKYEDWVENKAQGWKKYRMDEKCGIIE